ncbi:MULTISPECIES: hypothetical protein [unclassified Serratia (in: enterobacteria)]|uniref:hypothetical protein n=1 Tax=unclassified Serratia (in: enterobacteria) TaxID=2647522 RepID=UPI000468CCB4|nr:MULTISPECIES: hypothetical protein [unclassified Serratia (in: enterobacteria)]
MTKKTRITTRQFVDLILGKELSTSEIYELAHQVYPDGDLSRVSILTRLRNMVRSPHAEIVVKSQGNKARYMLISASEKFMARGEINYRAYSQPTVANETLWHFNPVELRFCHLHKMFDQALAAVRGNA